MQISVSLEPVPQREELSKRLDKEADQLAVGLSARGRSMEQCGIRKTRQQLCLQATPACLALTFECGSNERGRQLRASTSTCGHVDDL